MASASAQDSRFAASPPRWLKLAPLIVVALLAAGVFARAYRHTPSPTAPATRTAVVSGRVVMTGGPPKADSTSLYRPVPHTSVEAIGTTTTGRALQRRFTTDGDGRFSVRLPDGRYTVVATVFGTSSNALQSPAQDTVVVRGGRPVRARIVGHAY